MGIDNASWENGKKKAAQLIEKHVMDTLADIGRQMITDAYESKGYSGFTGNTQTSYACGIYKDGVLVMALVALTEFGLRNVIRVKVRKGEKAYLKEPYEGNARTIKGMVNITKDYGVDLSVDFLSKQSPKVKKGYSLIVCTGTEYSEYLEDVRNLNVLTQTYLKAKGGTFTKFKPI